MTHDSIFDSPFLYPILDDHRSVDLESDARNVIKAGARILQLRCKKMTNRDFYNVVSSLMPACKNDGVLLILNDRVDVCLVTGASGVHLGQDDFPAVETRQLLPNAIIGFSTHNINQVQAADQWPIDYISVGPVFATASKKNPDPVVGVHLLRKARAITTKLLVCIGGIGEAEIPELLEAGANGIAMISEIYQGNDVFKNTKRLLDLFSTQRHEGTKFHE